MGPGPRGHRKYVTFDELHSIIKTEPWIWGEGVAANALKKQEILGVGFIVFRLSKYLSVPRHNEPGGESVQKLGLFAVVFSPFPEEGVAMAH